MKIEMFEDVIRAAFAHTENRFGRRSILRSLLGKTNAAMVGTASSVVKRRLRGLEDSPTIDTYNEQESLAAEDTAPPYGLELRPDPMERLRQLKGLREAVIETANIPEMDIPALSETLKFMAQPRVVNKAAMEQLAEALGVPAEQLESVAKQMNGQDAQFLRDHGPEIMEMIDDTQPADIDSVDDFTKGRFTAWVVATLEKAQGWALQAVLRGRAEAISEVVLIKDAIQRINDWANAQSTEFLDGAAQ